MEVTHPTPEEVRAMQRFMAAKGTPIFKPGDPPPMMTNPAGEWVDAREALEAWERKS